MRKRILLTGIILLLFAFKMQAQEIKATSTEKAKQSQSEMLYFKIAGLKSEKDAAKLDEFMKAFDYILLSKTTFSSGICVIEVKTGNSQKLMDAFLIASNKLGYAITVTSTGIPQSTGTSVPN